MRRVGYLGLGSNVGDRESHLRKATDDLGRHEVQVEAVSSLYETEPVGEILDQPDFLNAAVRIRTALEPEALLDLCKAIEAEHGRVFGGPKHGPRRFVLAPLLELDRDLQLPDGTRLSEALERLGGGQRVNRLT